jgi:uncharacterized protein
MNRLTLSILISVLLLQQLQAQVVSSSSHKIIFQVTDGQPDMHAKFIRQLNNILEAAPNATMEVITHGMGVDLLKAADNSYHKDLELLKQKGIRFVVCENTMKQRNLTKAYFLDLVEYVPSAILELVIKQEEGWIYIKAGG